MPPLPIYTYENTTYAFQLCWGITLFWRRCVVPDTWLPRLTELCGSAGQRVLQHKRASDDCSQFLISTDPFMAADEIVRGLKGRLQSLIRKEVPKAFQRNYDVHSVGSTTRSKTEAYIRRQLVHHSVVPVGTHDVELADLQLENPNVDLGRFRFTSHGRYRCNLHLVFRMMDPLAVEEPQRLELLRSTIRKTAHRHCFLLSHIGLLKDHIHLVLGHSPDRSPASVCYSLMNNIAFTFGMQNVLWPSCYVGTIGEYDLGAVRKMNSQ
jgi:REP element-mobilizing transposase RayT